MEEKLLHIFYQNQSDLSTIREYIESISHLDELLDVQQIKITQPGISNAIYIDENRIHVLPDWLNQRPPVVFPSEIPFNKKNFIGIIFGMLNNAFEYPNYLAENRNLFNIFDLCQAIIHGNEADTILMNMLRHTEFAHPFENYVFNHNIAIALNYAHFSNDINPDAIKAHYNDALELAFEPSYKAFTMKYYMTFLTDIGESQTAIRLMRQQNFNHLEDYPKFAIKKAWCQAEMKQLTFPYNPEIIDELKNRLWETLQFFESNNHKSNAAFLYMDAATISGLSNSYSEALGYITKALSIFKEIGQKEMLAQAQIIRGRLFYDWAQSGNPQFYRSALEAYQEALSIFKKDEAPQVFADIHHQLGVIYAELPDENKKRSIWSALSVSSFNEALEFYTKSKFSYEYGMICNNYANAFSKYPQAKQSDNFEKALQLYDEALSVRLAEEFPTERTISLLNYLDASWKAGNPDDGFNLERFNNMQSKAIEIKMLTSEGEFLAEAEKHLEMLHALEKEMNPSVKL